MGQHLDASQVLPAFRAEVRGVLYAILKFALFYLLLMLLALGLLAATYVLGIAVIMIHVSFITLAVGLGMMALGTMVCVFLIKFIFSRSRVVDTIRIEVKPKDQPELFRLVNELADQIQAPRPKHVYLVPEVNASVSYDSTFWSMFLPVRKNLRIGLGLVNALSVPELRAVIAHEFGHFSQRSMKLGSYVYTVNRTIHDLVHHRDPWDRALQGWADAGGVFGWFAVFTSYIVQAVRRWLWWAYGWINRSYSSLSRQMEFHADAIAAHAVGADHLIEALYKVEYAGMAWESALGELSVRLNKGFVASDVYAVQRAQVAYHRKLNAAIPFDRVLDDIRRERIDWRPRLVIKDQWASHPSLEEREAHVVGIGNSHQPDTRSAWLLFANEEVLRRQMHDLLYEQAGIPLKEKVSFDARQYLLEMRAENDQYAIDSYYRSYYDDRIPKVASIEGLLLSGPFQEEAPEKLYSAENIDRTRRWVRGLSDLNTLQVLVAGGIDVEEFELDGAKYKKSEAPACLDRLSRELKAEEVWSAELDHRMQRAHMYAADLVGRGEGLRAALTNFITWSERIRSINSIMERGRSVHAELASKPRFDEYEWKRIGGSAEHFHVMLIAALRTFDHREALTDAEHELDIGALDRVSRMSFPQSNFEVEFFMGVLRATAVLENAITKRTKRALKDLTDIQLEWLVRPPASGC